MMQRFPAGMPMHTQWFMQTGARSFIGNVASDFLLENLSDRAMSCRFPQRRVRLCVDMSGNLTPPILIPAAFPCGVSLEGHTAYEETCT